MVMDNLSSFTGTQPGFDISPSHSSGLNQGPWICDAAKSPVLTDLSYAVSIKHPLNLGVSPKPKVQL